VEKWEVGFGAGNERGWPEELGFLSKRTRGDPGDPLQRHRLDLLLQDEIMKFRMSDEGDKAKASLLNAWLQAQRILEGAPSVAPGLGTGTISDTNKKTDQSTLSRTGAKTSSSIPSAQQRNKGPNQALKRNWPARCLHSCALSISTRIRHGKNYVILNQSID
jgi:hypothetical protein